MAVIHSLNCCIDCDLIIQDAKEYSSVMSPEDECQVQPPSSLVYLELTVSKGCRHFLSILLHWVNEAIFLVVLRYFCNLLS